MTKPITPRIVARWNLPGSLPGGSPPGRAYFHESGLQSFSGEEYAGCVGEEFYLPSSPGVDPISRATRQVAHFFRWGLPAAARNFQYLVGILWGNEQKDKLWDFFGFRDISTSPKDWPGNAELVSFVMKNGVLVPEEAGYKAICCEDGIEVMNAEAMHRRRSQNMEAFRLHPPKIGVRGTLAEFLIAS